MNFDDLVFPTVYQGSPFTDEAEIALAKLIATIYVADPSRPTQKVLDYAVSCWADTIEKRDGIWCLRPAFRLKDGSGRRIRLRVDARHP